MAGIMSPDVRMGTLVGAFCSTVALGVLLGGMLDGGMMLLDVVSESESERVMRPGSEEREPEIDESESVIRPGRESNDADGDESDSEESNKGSEGDDFVGEDSCDMFFTLIMRHDHVWGGMETMGVCCDSLDVGG